MKELKYYFPHDSNAKDDPKCMVLIDQLGMEGYGIYWVLIELLRDQNNYQYPMAATGAIARKYATSKEKVETVISNFGLFEATEDGYFFSPSLKKRMAPLDTKRKALSDAGKKGNEARWRENKGLPSLPDSQAIATRSQIEKNREEKSKEEKKKKENKLSLVLREFGEENLPTIIPDMTLETFILQMDYIGNGMDRAVEFVRRVFDFNVNRKKGVYPREIIGPFISYWVQNYDEKPETIFFEDESNLEGSETEFQIPKHLHRWSEKQNEMDGEKQKAYRD